MIDVVDVVAVDPVIRVSRGPAGEHGPADVVDRVVRDRDVRAREHDPVIHRLIHRRVRRRGVHVQVRDRQVLERAPRAREREDALARHALVGEAAALGRGLNRGAVVSTVERQIVVPVGIYRRSGTPVRGRHRRPRRPIDRDRRRTRPRPLHRERRADRPAQIHGDARADLTRTRTPIRTRIEERHRLRITTIRTATRTGTTLRHVNLRTATGTTPAAATAPA